MPTDTWSKEDKLSYWMNAYNAMTIDLILRNQPIASIKDIKDPWDQRLWQLGKKWYNLNEIEHQILRKMGDARIHFGINCASFSCPPILNEAFTADKVDTQLEALAKGFINDKQRNTITENSIEISKIFSWFAKDFKTNGTLIDFLNKYSDTPIASNAKKRFKDTTGRLTNNLLITPKLSIVIPTLNEAETIERLIKHLKKMAIQPELLELIVVDGGSTDDTQSLAKKNEATVIESSKGRAKQMNAGAAIAQGAILYFLHADSFPPEHYDQHIYNEVGKLNLAGCFRMRFDSNHWLSLIHI